MKVTLNLIYIVSYALFTSVSKKNGNIEYDTALLSIFLLLFRFDPVAIGLDESYEMLYGFGRRYVLFNTLLTFI